jgi:hypothetical protein
MQLSGSFSDFQVSKGQLTGFTRLDTRITTPDNSIQAVSNDYSGFSTPISKDLQDRLEQIAPSLVQASSAFLGGDEPAAASTAAAAANAEGGVSGNDRAASGGATAPVAAMGGEQQMVQPSLRIVGGVEAPTDRQADTQPQLLSCRTQLKSCHHCCSCLLAIHNLSSCSSCQSSPRL